VAEALRSVWDQDYEDIELIVVDDGSQDASKTIIKECLKAHPDVPFIDIPDAIGNCAAFNKGWALATGQYGIDLAADDILLPDRVTKGVMRLQETGAGVHFSDALIIDPSGKTLSRHNERFDFPIPEGNLYSTLVSQYLICPPTMMFTREVMDYLGGYDPSLTYEDFDFWVRSARAYDYCFTDEVLVKKRHVRHSHSASQHRWFNVQQNSTYRVCKKILEMNETPEEHRALRKRCWHEIRQCIKKGNLILIPGYLSILDKCRV
jgi:glycosyltransferase involved in cell wall biosynthesis